MWRKWRKEGGKKVSLQKTHTLPSGTNTLFRRLIINCYHVTLDVSTFPLYHWSFPIHIIHHIARWSYSRWVGRVSNLTKQVSIQTMSQNIQFTEQPSQSCVHTTQPESVSGLSRFCKTSDRVWNILGQLVEMLKEPCKKKCAKQISAHIHQRMDSL